MVHHLLVALFWPSQTWFSELVSLLEGDQWEIPVRKDLLVLASGQNLAPTYRDLEVVGMAALRSPLAFDLSDGVRETINSDRALSTMKLYSSKWKVFESWGLVHAVDPVLPSYCPVSSVLEFL